MAVVRTGQDRTPTNGKRLTRLPVPARNARGYAREVTPMKDTSLVQYSTFEEMFTPNWDTLTASEQQIRRIADRTNMGIKRTPRGSGRLKPPIGKGVA